MVQSFFCNFNLMYWSKVNKTQTVLSEADLMAEIKYYLMYQKWQMLHNPTQKFLSFLKTLALSVGVVKLIQMIPAVDKHRVSPKVLSPWAKLSSSENFTSTNPPQPPQAQIKFLKWSHSPVPVSAIHQVGAQLYFKESSCRTHRRVSLSQDFF